MGVVLQIWRWPAGLGRASGSLASALCYSGQESGLESPLPTLPLPTWSVHVLTHSPSALPKELCRLHNPFHWGNYMQTLAKPDNY